MTQEEIIEMARSIDPKSWVQQHPDDEEWCIKFAKLVAAAEREACAQLVYNSPPSDEYENPLKAVYEAIRARGEA
jgi:hypothetical protein